MNWEKKLEEWENHPVTIAFKEEIKEDIRNFIEVLIYPIDENKNYKSPEECAEIRGFIKALRGILDMGVTDPILDPREQHKGE